MDYSVREAVQHILPELKCRKIFPAAYLVQAMFLKKESKHYFQQKKNLPGDSRKSAAENSVLNDFCYAEFLAYYTLDNNSNKTCEYQPDELDDNLIDNGHEVFWGFLPK